MAGALLRTGKLEQYKPLGDDGKPVYRSADQLREAIRLQLDAEATKCLAIPQVNDTGDEIDWYAPIEGPVVPWTSATPEEKTAAKAKLADLRDRLQGIVEGIDDEEKSEKRTFGRLLRHAIYFPDESHVYIVNDTPIITFWGFADPDAPVRDPISVLTIPVAQAVVQEAVTAPVEEEKVVGSRFPWWLWPLLLLLLLLLFLLWWFYWPENEVALEPIDPLVTETTDDEVLLDPGVDETLGGDLFIDEDRDAVIVDDNGNRYVVRNGVRYRVDSTGALSRVTSSDVTTDTNATSDENLVDNLDLLEPNALTDPASDPMTDPAADPMGTEDPLTGDPSVTPPEVPLPQDDPSAQTDPVASNPPTDQPSGTDETLPNGLPGETPSGGEVPGNDPNTNTSTTQQGPPLTIPQDAAQSGDVSFMDGGWKATTALRDRRTGKPVNLEYELDNGKGKVKIRRGDGTVCTGDATASTANGGVSISGGSARCPDGTVFRAPAVQCQTGSDGNADCTGTSQNGQTFGVGIRKQPGSQPDTSN